MNASNSDSASPTFSPLSIARMLWKRKFFILITWLVLGAAGVAVVWRLPAIYISEALILVDSQKIPEKFVSSTVSAELQDRLATINQQILSTNRLKKVIDDFGLYKEERKTKYDEEILETMRADISVKPVRGWGQNRDRTGAFRVGYQGSDPAITAQVANRIANLYIEENLKTREVQAEGTAEFIDVQLQDAKKRLDELEAAVSVYKLKHSGELPEQQNALLGALSGLHVQLEANRDALNRTQQNKLSLELNLQTLEDARDALARANAASAAAGGSPVDASVPAAPAKKPSKALEEQIELLKVRLTDQHPDIRRLQEDLRKLKALEKETDGSASTLPVAAAQTDDAKETAPAPAKPVPAAAQTGGQIQLNARIQELKSQLTIVGKELETRKGDQAKIVNDINAVQARVSKLPIREQEMAGLVRDYDLSKAHYKSLFDKKTAAAMSTDMERRQKSERFTIIDPAPIPQLPAKPNRLLFSAMAILGGLVLGVAFALGNEMRKDLLLGEWELPADVRVVARLPQFSISPGAALEAPSSGNPKRFRSKVLVAIVSSVVLGLLGAAAVGMYLLRHRF